MTGPAFAADTSLPGVTVMPSPNHGPRAAGAAVDLLVLHYTGMPDGSAALRRMCQAEAQVSAHYMVEEDGRIFQLVPEARRAWHAGVARWRGRADVNSHSIGIEIVNPGHEFGYRPFPAVQMQAVAALCRDILDRHPAILPGGVVAHADVAPARKEDPGELFDWPFLADQGVGLFPAPVAGAGGDAAALLRQIGYPLGEDGAETPEGLRAALVAFQRRYRPSELTGQADAGTLAMLTAVARALKPEESIR
ncbi:N-acetylmuramoyl-L-alanine amidase [Novispirillum itersonii]|uniref:N-acetylmuramoyl-L-alanine amidase n=1 Tax=Novispirillum itersonii TaxID=189 RepID=A0A7X0DQ64_NOVIT|nr:N-acetylmuramoyl-L-alanine amidase [Novispirillum itersonii]MBB6211967.1 N-acetylmuramoyl-L-alanine amidase [Novispirillum itersonii]